MLWKLIYQDYFNSTWLPRVHSTARSTESWLGANQDFLMTLLTDTESDSLPLWLPFTTHCLPLEECSVSLNTGTSPPAQILPPCHICFFFCDFLLCAFLVLMGWSSSKQRLEEQKVTGTEVTSHTNEQGYVVWESAGEVCDYAEWGLQCISEYYILKTALEIPVSLCFSI